MRRRDHAYYAAQTGHFDHSQLPVLVTYANLVAEYLDPIWPRLQDLAARRNPLRIIELGAGTCMASLIIRKRLPAAEFTCLDISLPRVEKLIAAAAAALGSDCKGVHLVEADFSDRLPLNDAQFDVVLFNAALHHSRNIWMTLDECQRVLAPEGAVIALREQYLAPLTYGYALRRLLRTPDVAGGVSESAFLRAQYEYYFLAAGFDPLFHAVNPGRFRMLWLLNGLAFSKWSIWAAKRAG